LLVCLKYPAAGQVKTRLAESLGDQRAAELYRQWIGLVFEQMQPLRGSVHVVGYFTGAPAEAFGEWRDLADDWWPQPDGDLGTRLAAGFERAHARGGTVAAIGTDCFEIDAALVGDAFARLERHDAVFGPTLDGGYYLVGTSRHVPEFFDGVPWSCTDTLSTHMSLCDQRGLSTSLLPQRRDVDTVEDWQACIGQADTAWLSVAVVVPTLNEETILADTLASVRLQTVGEVRLIVADGGSTDATSEVAMRFGAEVFRAPRRGRGCQIAAAIATLQEDVVLVLHADTHLPPDAVERIRGHLRNHANCPGGCLGHRFDSPRAAYRLVEAVDALRARWGTSYGDQGQFFRRAPLARAGGFPDQPIMEDVELSRRLRAQGQPAYLNCPVLASPRRLERLGLWQSATVNFLLRTAYRVGGAAVCDRLDRLYYPRADRRDFTLATTPEMKP
jgi:rSAM/selenodomain-associated transferase 2/rSAM/selenodomain-associated transferase 1